MIKLLHYLSTLIIGTVSGMLLFGIWLVAFFCIYSVFFGPFVYFEIAFLGVASVENPFTEGLVAGGAIGLIPGALSSVGIIIWKPTTLFKHIAISLVVMTIFLVGIFLLIESTNVSHIIVAPFAVMNDLPVVAILETFFLVPIVAVSAIIFVYNRMTASWMKVKTLR